MEIRTIFEDNIYEYTDHVDEDVAENMGRMCYRGIAGHDPDDDNVLSLHIWELRAVENNRETVSELKWIYAVDPACIHALMDGYHIEARDDEIKKTSFESEFLDSYTVQRGESILAPILTF